MGEETRRNENSTFHLLSEHDRVLLEKGALEISREIANNFPHELPKVIVLPDTSARPFKYLFDPVLGSIAQERGVEPPHFVFFQTPPYYQKEAIKYIDYWGNSAEAKRSLQDGIVSAKKNITFYTRLFNKEKYEQNRKIVEEQESILKEIDNVPAIREQQKNRAAEIKAKYKCSNDELAVIDDTMISNGFTMNLVKDSFGDTSGNEIRGYVLTADSPYSNNVFAAQQIDVTSPDTSKHPLKYRRAQQEFGSARHAFGVEKSDVLESNYVTPSADDRNAMTALRHEMRMIGEKVVQKLREN